MNRVKTIGAVAALTLAARGLAAQTPADTVRLPAIVVTATRLPAARDEVPSAVTVLEGAELERRGITRVTEALRLVPGVTVIQSGAPGAVTSLFVRGGESDFVRVLVDGVPANQPGGTINLADLTTDNVERIEVVRGPASALYGSDAVSGVVHIITRRGAGRPQTRLSARATDDGSAVSASVAGGSSAVGYSLGASHLTAPGVYRFNHRYDGWSAGGALRAAPDARSDVTLAVRHQDGVFHYPTDYTGAPVDSNQYTAARLTVVSLEAGRALTRRLEVRAQLGFTDGLDRAVDTPDGPSDVDAYSARTPYGRRSADVRANLRTARGGVVTLGGVVERQHFRGSFQPGGLERTNRAVYAQLVGPTAGGDVVVTGGVRVEDNQRFGTFATVRGGFSARLLPRTVLRASAGTAFKEPTFYENYGGDWSVGNPNLAPERSASGEVGVEQRLAGGRGMVGVTLFTQWFDSLIQYSLAGPAGGPQYYNLAGARSRGLELEVRAAPWRGGSLAFGWTWLRTAVVDSGVDGTTYADDRPLVRRPAHSGTLALDQSLGAFDAGVTVLYVGRREDLDFRSSFSGTRTTLPAYARLDARLRWRALALDATNLLDERYAEALGFPAGGRTIWVGAALGR